MISTRKITGSLACLWLVFAAGLAGAQSYPAKPISLVVPFPPGGPIDVMARLTAQQLSASLGQNIVVDNRPGAASTMGATYVARAAPDGYTLFFGTSSALANAPSIYPNLTYDPVKSFAPVILTGVGVFVMGVNPALPVKTVKEFVDYVKANPGKVNFGSSGSGTSLHLTAEMLKMVAGLDMVHIPYKGGAAATQALVTGDIQLLFDGLTTLLPQIRAGKVRALAVATLKRNAALPDVPTIDESGYPGFDSSFWTGIVAPVGTPRDIVLKLNAAARKALTGKELSEAMLRQGVDPAPGTPEEFGAFIQSETLKWGRVIRAAGVKAE